MEKRWWVLVRSGDWSLERRVNSVESIAIEEREGGGEVCERREWSIRVEKCEMGMNVAHFRIILAKKIQSPEKIPAKLSGPQRKM